MKKLGLVLVLVLVLLTLFPGAAFADMGPKPSVVIDFKGLEGESYCVTLLSRTETTGPYSVLKESNENYARYQEGDEDYEIFRKFVEYEDEDGYHFLQYFQNCTETQQFTWTYYPPQDFKILLYFPETEQFAISAGNYERYAFDSYFTVEVSPAERSALTMGTGEIAAKRSYYYTKEFLSLLERIILTLAVELALIVPFRFGSKPFIRFVVIVNVITQIALNLVLSWAYFYSGPLAFAFYYVLLEVAIILVEGAMFYYYVIWHINKEGIKVIPKWKPWVYALVANGASFALGIKLADHWPGIF